MKNFKKFLALFMLLLLAVGTMTACGSDDDDDDNEKDEELSYKQLKGEWSGEKTMGMLEFCDTMDEGASREGAKQLANVLKEVGREPQLRFEMKLDFTSKDTLEMTISMNANIKECLMEITADEEKALKLIALVSNVSVEDLRAQIAASGRPVKEYTDRLAEQLSGLDDSIAKHRSEEYEYSLKGNKIIIDEKKDKYYFKYKESKKGISMVITEESEESELFSQFFLDILMTK